MKDFRMCVYVPNLFMKNGTAEDILYVLRRI